MYISRDLFEKIQIAVKQGRIRDAENESWIADEAVLKNGNIYLTFTDYSQSSHEYWENEEDYDYTKEDFESDKADRAYKEDQEERLIWSKQ